MELEHEHGNVAEMQLPLGCWVLTPSGWELERTEQIVRAIPQPATALAVRNVLRHLYLEAGAVDEGLGAMSPMEV